MRILTESLHLHAHCQTGRVDRITPGIIAVFVGAVAGFALFVPFVAASYRRRGGLRFGRLVLWASALVYFWAIWAYTLLPLPEADSIRCVGSNLDLFELVNDIGGALGRPGPALTDPAVLQLLLNVLLFMPLGFFIRVLAGRGILVALAVGLGVSALIETTQLTGVWGLYSCAYRVFDVDDMLTNTTGAVLGSLLALFVPARHRGSGKSADAAEPRPVTRGRRALAMLCDIIAFSLVSATAGVATQLVLEAVGRGDLVLEAELSSILGTLVPAGLWLVVILASGRSVGDLAVQLRYRGGPVPTWLARPLRWAGGISGYVLLGALPTPWSLAGLLFGLATFVLLFTTSAGRGLPGILSGMSLTDAREGSSGDQSRNSRAATTSASTPTSSVGWSTGAKNGE
ncbi:VanZ like protein [Microbacterium sp. SLBN-146]|nr:VanZ like protein [Microbacterium sp. SLBN-146]